MRETWLLEVSVYPKQFLPLRDRLRTVNLCCDFLQVLWEKQREVEVMDHRIFLAIALIVSNVSLFYLSVSVISLLHGAQRRSYGFVKSRLHCSMHSPSSIGFPSASHGTDATSLHRHAEQKRT